MGLRSIEHHERELCHNHPVALPHHSSQQWHVAAKVVGGWAHLLKLFFERVLFGSPGLCETGIALDLGGGTAALIFARVANVLADGDGLMKGFDWKGAASLKPCIRHVNVLKKAWNRNVESFTVVNPRARTQRLSRSRDATCSGNSNHSISGVAARWYFVFGLQALIQHPKIDEH